MYLGVLILASLKNKLIIHEFCISHFRRKKFQLESEEQDKWDG
jgi:hypothetical protein